MVDDAKGLELGVILEKAQRAEIEKQKENLFAELVEKIRSGKLVASQP